MTVTLAQQNRARYGFQLTAIDDSGKRAGDLIPNDNRTQTQINNVIGNDRQYINHTGTGNTPTASGQGSWTFRWKAPAQSVGRVTFYVAGNAANGNLTTSGDTIYTINRSIQPAALLTPFATVSAASFALNAPLAANGIVAGFGSQLANQIAAATDTDPNAPGIQLPTQLGGAEIRVKDAAGADRPAGLFFVSPDQINYLIPPGTANGTATITVRRDGADTAQGTATIESVAPSLFTANASGQGVPAAALFRRRGAVDTFEPVAQFNATSGRFEPLQIDLGPDLGPDTDLVLLIAYGTGLRGLSSQTGATATIGGTNAQVLFTGEVSGLEGLDQTNIIIPRSLIGRGLVDVVFMVDSKQANTVQLNIK